MAPERPYPRRDVSEDDAGQLWNWARNSQLAGSEALVTASSELEVRSLLASRPGRVRLVGSRMSSGRMLAPGGPSGAEVLLDVRGHRGLIAHGEDWATFAGGTVLQDVYDALAALGRMLPSSPGVIAEQTLGGALATGTHGQGLQQSSIGDALLSLRLVMADGSVEEFGADHPWFGALQVGLGTLGVVTAVTLRTVPVAVYSCVKGATSAATLEDDLIAWNRGHEMAKAWWFPDDEKVHVWTAQRAAAPELAAWEAGGRQLVERTETSDAMNRAVDAALAHMRADTRIVDAQGKPFRTVTRFKDFSDVTGDVYQVFMRGIATPQINVEIGVPLDRAPAVVEKIRAWHAETSPHLHYPIILRATGGSRAWLSPSEGGDTLYFGFVVYYAEDGSLSDEGVDFLVEVEKLLAAEGGRPHWGKYFDETLYDWPALYPRWHDFLAVREALDPERVFSNAFTDRLFPAVSQASEAAA